MAYDYHSSRTDTPGPVTPIGWLKEVLDYAQATIDPDKLVVGLGNYGYDWIEPSSEGESWQGTGVSYDRAFAIAQEKESPIVRMSCIDDRWYDIGSIPMFTYKDDANQTHSLWFEDATSLADKVALTQQYHIKALIFWSVGLGDRAFWQSTTN